MLWRMLTLCWNSLEYLWGKEMERMCVYVVYTREIYIWITPEEKQERHILHA